MARKSKDDAEEEDGGRDAEDSASDGDESKKGDKSKDSDGPEPKEEQTNRNRYVGLGLMASVLVGFSPLRDAVLGNGPFENAMARFLACVVACIFAASVLGRMIDAAPEPEPEDEEHDADAAIDENDDRLNDGGAAGDGGPDGIGAETSDPNGPLSDPTRAEENPTGLGGIGQVTGQGPA